MRKFLIITAYILSSILGLGFVFLIVFIMYDAHVARAKQSWEWQHYSGDRLIARDDTAHGIFQDKKTNKDCSTLGYPGYPACPEQAYYVNGETLEHLCKTWEDKHPIGSPVDRLPDGATLGAPEGCKGPLETAYEEKIPKIDFDALAKKNGGVVITPDEPTLWLAVDPFQQFGGRYVRPPSLPKSMIASCQAGSRVWHDKVQWICVRDMARPEHLPDDAILVPGK
jgi:hypothetical protein